MRCSKSSSKRDGHSNTGHPQKQEKSQINKLTYNLKELEKEEQIKPKVSKMKEIIKIREEINKKEIKKQEKRAINPRAVFFVCLFVLKINKIDKPLARLIKKKRERTQKKKKKTLFPAGKKKRERTQINKIRKEIGETTADTIDIQKNHKRIL